MKPSKTLLAGAIFSSFICLESQALQRKDVADVSSDALISETQTGPENAGDDHTSLVWWIPYEFWEGLMRRDGSLSEEEKEEMLKAVKNVSILTIVQGDISSLGAIDFYSKEEVAKNMVVSQTRPDGSESKVPIQNNLNPNLEVVLAAFKPILATAMGRLGDNMHFFVLNDVDEGVGRRIDPYKGGTFKVMLRDKGGGSLISEIDLPLDCLFEARTCPNGKKAHVSWNFCPWTGEKLSE
jgi:hypothetical protein